MATNPEPAAFAHVIARHQSGTSENDIRTALQRFAATADISDRFGMSTERRPAQATQATWTSKPKTPALNSKPPRWQPAKQPGRYPL